MRLAAIRGMRPEARTEAICHLSRQVAAIHQAIQMLEKECPCVEVIKRIQLVQVALHMVNAHLINGQLETCLATAQDDSEQALDEISVIFACVDKS